MASSEIILEPEQPRRRWTSVLGGAAVAIGLWLTLQILGIGIGVAADTDDAGTSRGASIGAWIWSIIAALIAVFVGIAFTRQLASRDRRGGATP